MGFFKRRALRKRLDVLHHDDYTEMCRWWEGLARRMASINGINYASFIKVVMQGDVHPVGITLATDVYNECAGGKLHTTGTTLSLALIKRLVEIEKAASVRLLYGSQYD